MAHYPSKIIDGTKYDLSHLDPFDFTIDQDGKSYRLRVQFGHHCFTEERESWHSPERVYRYKNETRSFCTVRFKSSLTLKYLITSLSDKTVYHGKEYNYFVLRNYDLLGNAPPYAVFFDVQRSRNKRLSDVFMRVQSAYQKPNMVESAAPISFFNLVDAIANGSVPAPGRRVTIKRLER